MPELPEAETVARTIYPHIRGCFIKDAHLFREKTLHALSLPLADLRGLSIKGTRRRGKLILIDLEAGDAANKPALPEFLVFHLRMTGRLVARDAQVEPTKHTRCLFELTRPDGSPARLFFDDARAFGQIFAASGALLASWDFWKNLGPEPLEMAPDDLAPRLATGRPIKTALLDQQVLAGIGNIYADESLYKAGIHPLRPASSLTAEESRRLLKSIQAILTLSISQCGSSIRDYVDANGNAGAFQNSFAVYGRGGKKCKKCGSQLEKIRLGGRATVFCPQCQQLAANP